MSGACQVCARFKASNGRLPTAREHRLFASRTGARSKTVQLECPVCGKPCYFKWSEIRANPHRYCSRVCAGIATHMNPRPRLAVTLPTWYEHSPEQNPIRATPPCPKCGGTLARSSYDRLELDCLNCGKTIYLEQNGQLHQPQTIEEDRAAFRSAIRLRDAEIRRRYSEGASLTVLAGEYEITTTACSYIISRGARLA